MSNRLDKDREAKLQPERRNTAVNILHNTPNVSNIEVTKTTIYFTFKENKITFFPYSGWHQGKGIKAGRGLQNLLKQLKS